MTAEALDRRSSPEMHPAAALLRLASGQAVAWTPWSAPVQLDERSNMVLGLLDGEVTLDWLADEFSVAFDADRELVLTDPIATAYALAVTACSSTVGGSKPVRSRCLAMTPTLELWNGSAWSRRKF